MFEYDRFEGNWNDLVNTKNQLLSQYENHDRSITLKSINKI